jgi:hypothetical protein
MLELMLKMNPHFTKEDRAACEPVIARILELAIIARREGILALEQAVQNEPDCFLKESLIAVVDAVEPEHIRKLMSYMIVSSDATGADLLRKFIMAEGVFEIQAGCNPRWINIMLGAILGGDYLSRLRAAENAEKDYVPTLGEFYEMIKHRKAEPGELEEKLMSMPDETISASISRADDSDLAIALMGLSADAIHKLMDNIDIKKALDVISIWKQTGPVRVVDVESAMKNVIRELRIDYL